VAATINACQENENEMTKKARNEAEDVREAKTA
jgi:hypothetical protein